MLLFDTAPAVIDSQSYSRDVSCFPAVFSTGPAFRILESVSDTGNSHSVALLARPIDSAGTKRGEDRTVTAKIYASHSNAVASSQSSVTRRSTIDVTQTARAAVTNVVSEAITLIDAHVRSKLALAQLSIDDAFVHKEDPELAVTGKSLVLNFRLSGNHKETMAFWKSYKYDERDFIKRVPMRLNSAMDRIDVRFSWKVRRGPQAT